MAGSFMDSTKHMLLQISHIWARQFEHRESGCTFTLADLLRKRKTRLVTWFQKIRQDVHSPGSKKWHPDSSWASHQVATWIPDTQRSLQIQMLVYSLNSFPIVFFSGYTLFTKPQIDLYKWLGSQVLSEAMNPTWWSSTPTSSSSFCNPAFCAFCGVLQVPCLVMWINCLPNELHVWQISERLGTQEPEPPNILANSQSTSINFKLTHPGRVADHLEF